jgi:hypothetical protein
MDLTGCDKLRVTHDRIAVAADVERDRPIKAWQDAQVLVPARGGNAWSPLLLLVVWYPTVTEASALTAVPHSPVKPGAMGSVWKPVVEVQRYARAAESIPAVPTTTEPSALTPLAYEFDPPAGTPRLWKPDDDVHRKPTVDEPLGPESMPTTTEPLALTPPA